MNALVSAGAQTMTLATTASGAGRSPLRHLPVLAAGLAAAAVVLLALGPIGWRAGWWHFRTAFFSLMPWAAYCGLAAMAVAILAVLFGRRSLRGWPIAIAAIALLVGAAIAYVPWHYNSMRGT